MLLARADQLHVGRRSIWPPAAVPAAFPARTLSAQDFTSANRDALSRIIGDRGRRRVSLSPSRACRPPPSATWCGACARSCCAAARRCRCRLRRRRCRRFRCARRKSSYHPVGCKWAWGQREPHECQVWHGSAECSAVCGQQRGIGRVSALEILREKARSFRCYGSLLRAMTGQRLRRPLASQDHNSRWPQAMCWPHTRRQGSAKCWPSVLSGWAW